MNVANTDYINRFILWALFHSKHPHTLQTYQNIMIAKKEKQQKNL